MSIWKQIKIGEIGDVIGGGTPSTNNDLYYGEDIPWITPKDLSGYQSMYISKGARGITKLGLRNSSARILPKGTVLFSSRAPIGYVAIAENEVTTNQGFKSIVCDEKIANNKFIYYSLLFNKEKIESVASGSTFKEISGNVLKNLEISLPDIKEQEEIAEILSSLDEKIEINRKININLEKIASSIFKKWFVDFGDELPEGWKLGTLGEAIKNFDSKRIPLHSGEREKRRGVYPYHGATSVMDYVDDFIFDGVYVLLGEDGSVVREDGTPFVQYVSGKIWVNNHAHVLQGKNGFSTEYIKVFLNQADITPFVTGAVQPKLNQSNMNSIPMIIPDQKTLDRFNEVLTTLFGMILENENQTKNLEKIRDSLLPRLMNGKIRVKI